MNGYPDELSQDLNAASLRILQRLECSALEADVELWESDPALACQLAFGKLQSLWLAQQSAGIYTGFPKQFGKMNENDDETKKGY